MADFDDEQNRMADFDIRISERGLFSVVNDAEAFSNTTSRSSSVEVRLLLRVS